MTNTQHRASRLLAQSYRFLPTNLVSRAWGRIARTGVSRHMIRPFAKLFRVAMGEAEMAPGDYPSLNAFFTRRLKAGSRPIDPDPQAVVSPVDGRVSFAGSCDRDRLLQIKGIHFDLFGLLRDGPMARRFEDGSYMTIYLSPQDYHRIHAPLELSVHTLGYLPGTLLPVNPPSVRWIPGLYNQNERIILYADTPAGLVAMVLVGAHCVGSISLRFHDFTTNRSGRGPMRLNFDPPVFVKKGEELGAFEMGSTVLLLFEKGKTNQELPKQGRTVRLGQRIGTILGSDQPDAESS